MRRWPNWSGTRFLWKMCGPLEKAGLFTAMLALVSLAFLLTGCGTSSGFVSAPLADLSVSALSFPATTTGSVTPSISVTLSNPGQRALSLGAYALSDTSDFGVTTSCGETLAAQASCAFVVVFHPQAAGDFSASLTLTDDSGGASGTRQMITLRGMGIALPMAQAVLAPQSLQFGSTVLHHATVAQAVTLSNTGTAPLEIGGATVSDTTDFTLVSTCAAVVAPGASCALSLAFQPQSIGPVQAVLTVVDNSGGARGTPQTVQLSGTGLPIPVPQLLLQPASLSFPGTVLQTSSIVQTIALSNTGSASLAISGAALADPTDYGLSSTCGTALAAGTSCSLEVTFHPQTIGSLPTTITLTDNSGVTGGTVQQTVPLLGSGLPIPLPQASVTPSAAGFGAVNVGATSAAQTFLLVNTGSAPLTLAGISLSDTSDYGLMNRCGATLSPAASCSFLVVFHPQTAGALNGTAILSDNSGGVAGAQQVLALSGSGAAPTAVLSPAALRFPDTMLTTSAAVQTTTLLNAGNATLNLSGAALSDTLNFSLSSTCGATLLPGASCSFTVGFQPGAIAHFGATLTLTDNSGASTTTAQQVIPIAGNGIAFSEPRAAALPTTLSFPQTVTNSSAAPQAVTLTNTGTTPLTVSAVALIGSEASAFALNPGSCVGTLFAGSSCTVTVTFSPLLASAGTSATLVFTDDSLGRSGSTQAVALTGSALAEVDTVANFGDSLTCGYYAMPNDGTGYVWSQEGYAGLFDVQLGVPVQNNCRGGDTAADLSRLLTLFDTASTSTGNQLYTLMVGVNDAYRYGIPQSSLTAYTAEVGAALSWLAIPNSDKVLANTITQRTGSWSQDVGFGLTSTDSRAALTFNVNQAAAGRNLYLVYHVWALPYGQAGKATIAVDGVVQATVDESQSSLVNLPTENGTSDTFLVQIVPLGAVGPHTVTFSSAGPAGSAVGLMWAGAPQQDYRAVDGAPRVLVGMVTNSPSGNQTFAADNYNLQLVGLIPALGADGMNLVLVPTDRLLDTNTDFHDILHPNNAGHAKLAAAFAQYR